MARGRQKKQHSKAFRVVWTIYKVIITTFKVLLLTVPFLASIAYVNYTIDPGRLYHTDRDDLYEYDMVRIMLEGHNVENVQNYNERLTKREYLYRMPEAKDYIVAGSSRCAMIDKNMLGVESLFNVGVAGAQLQDVVAFYGMLDRENKLPQTLLLVLDPWMLNDNYGDKRYQWSLGDYYYYFVTDKLGYSADVSLVTGVESKYLPGTTEADAFSSLTDAEKANLLSITYFQAGVQRWMDQEKGIRPDNWPKASDDYIGTNGLLRSDGSFSYPENYRNLSVEEASHEARMSLPYNLIGLEDYDNLDSANKQLLLDLIAEAQRDGVTVQILLLPISTLLYEWMQQFPDHYVNFFKAEQLMYDIAEQTGVPITGTYDPYKLDLDMGAFYDGYHVKVEEIDKLIQPFVVT